MHRYRTHTCGGLRESDVGATARVSGWVHRKRDHGNLLFIDLRDHHGLTQCVVETGAEPFAAAEAARHESVLTVTGPVVARDPDTVNPRLPTGRVEVRIESLEVLSAAEELPLRVFGEQEYPEETRLRHRFLDLRRERLHRNIALRSDVIASIRRRMIEQGFSEYQTPILTASSPEGARDFLVPSRQHPGKFYALPQAPQQFKQLYMVAGFDRYFQIAPCFRDEDARADRSPGEFYQLDMEMSFVEQEDVFAVMEPVMHGVFEEFTDREISPPPFPRIPFAEAMLKYGTDKPDLRNPLEIGDCTEAFRGGAFGLFGRAIDKGAVVRAIPAPGAGGRPRGFFDRLNDWARGEGWPGLGYVVFEDGGGKGPIANNLEPERVERIGSIMGAADGDAVFFACDRPDRAAALAGLARTRLAEELALSERNAYRFCWIVDYPMYEWEHHLHPLRAGILANGLDAGKMAGIGGGFLPNDDGLTAIAAARPLVGVGRFELPISCSQSRRLAARPHPDTKPAPVKQNPDGAIKAAAWRNAVNGGCQVPPWRFELQSLAPEASTLSTELRGH